MDWTPMIATEALESVALTDYIRSAISTSEKAVLDIGRFLEQIVQIATQSIAGNSMAREAAFAERLQSLASSATSFIDETRSFLHRQADFAEAANVAFQRIYSCSSSVSGLMRRSHLLALNMQIEAARLSLQNTAFEAIGVEMAQFASEVRTANTKIIDAIEELSVSLPNIAKEATAMSTKAESFSINVKGELRSIEELIAGQRAAQNETIRLVGDRNNKIVSLSNQTLTALQFQDPMAQQLGRVIDVMEGGPLDQLKPIIAGFNGTPDRNPGDLELF